MALLTDSDIVSLADLTQIESEISTVAAAESITVQGTGSVIRQSWAEIKNEILEAQQQYSVGYWGYQNVLAIGASFATAARIKAAQVCTTSGYSADVSWLKTWMIYRALANFYDEASARKVKDRYELKATRFQARAKRAFSTLWANGLPIVFRPMECPGAIHAFAAGIWGASNVTGVAGGTDGGGSYDVAITYVDLSLYSSPNAKGNAESGPSAVVTYALAPNNHLAVSIASLNPPNGLADQIGTADGIVTPLNATGWNIYVGLTGGLLTLQNVTPIPIATKSFTFPAAPGNAGPVIGPGQYPDRNLPLTRTFDRA